MRHVDEGQLHAWLDRERSGLPAGEAAEIERHFRDCAECHVRLDEARLIVDRAAGILATAGPVEIRQPDFEVVRGSGRRSGRSA